MGPGLSTEVFIIGYSVNTMKSPRFLRHSILPVIRDADADCTVFNKSECKSREALAINPQHGLFRVPPKPEIMLDQHANNYRLFGTGHVCLWKPISASRQDKSVLSKKKNG